MSTDGFVDGPAVRRRFLELRDPATGEQRRQLARDELVELYVPMAYRVARRFRNRNEPVEDLGQVALLGLLKAVDGFDPDRSVSFSSYAIPTMLGEIKRHFRDKGWSLHVPRRLKELSLDVVSATADLPAARPPPDRCRPGRRAGGQRTRGPGGTAVCPGVSLHLAVDPAYLAGVRVGPLRRSRSRSRSALPDQVDTEQDQGLLSKFGVDAKDLTGGLGGKLGR